MRFYADLHVHSRFSRATSPSCGLEQLWVWAQKKGLAVLGAGDCVHPRWGRELEEKLIPAEPGLFQLRPALETALVKDLPPACHSVSRFVLSAEISTIYKQDARVRKVHHGVLVPGFDAARRLCKALARHGNLDADGRPILPLDSRSLLEIVLECGEGSFLFPAHMWTPWFSALGAKSGFDSLEECYGDLAPHIFAAETGLSSDPPMNWRMSSLDRFRLLSNSDAHSPIFLGRNACVFETSLDFFALRRALETGEGYAGTLDTPPETGKYHLDGHRTCGVCLQPEDTQRHGGLCPQCGKPLTMGVLHRVEALADRPAGAGRPKPEPFRRVVPLIEILAELEGVGARSKRVAKRYEALLTALGPELPLLATLPCAQIERKSEHRLAEAIRRMRAGQITCAPGFDGRYGRVRLFSQA